MRYAVVIEKAGGNYSAFVPDLPGCIATGATVIVALRALRVKRPRRVVLAVPVAPGAVVPQLRAECDQIVLLSAPEPFIAVGYFYENFAQVTDDEVLQILHS